MYVHEGAKLVYLAAPRTASQATAAALQAIGFVKPVPGDHHSQLFTAGPVTPKNRWEWQVFTVVRNHWDTAVSWVFAKHQGSPPAWTRDTFKSALADNPWVGPHTLWHLHDLDADHVLRFENLSDHLAALLAAHGLPAPELPRKNVSRGRWHSDHRVYFTAESRRYITERFSREILALGYAFDRPSSGG